LNEKHEVIDLPAWQLILLLLLHTLPLLPPKPSPGSHEP